MVERLVSLVSHVLDVTLERREHNFVTFIRAFPVSSNGRALSEQGF